MLADNFGSKSVVIEDEASPVVENRLGRFVLNRELFRRSYAETRVLFDSVTIVRAEMLLYEDGIEYVAYSPHFEPVDDGALMPTYVAQITRDEFGKIKLLKWVKH